MMTTTVRMVHSTMEAMPTAKLMKEKLRASREAISAVTMSPLAIAVRTCDKTSEQKKETREETCCVTGMCGSRRVQHHVDGFHCSTGRRPTRAVQLRPRVHILSARLNSAS